VIYSNFHEVLRSASNKLDVSQLQGLERAMLFLVSQWEHDHQLQRLFKQTVDKSSTQSQWWEVKKGGKRKNSPVSSGRDSGDEDSRPSKRKKPNTLSSGDESKGRPDSPKTGPSSPEDRTNHNRFVIPDFKATNSPRTAQRTERRERSREKKEKSLSPPMSKGGDPETPKSGKRDQALDLYNQHRNRHQPELRTPPPPPTTFTKAQGWKERNRAKLDSRGISKN
jgi:hypothetical protein